MIIYQKLALRKHWNDAASVEVIMMSVMICYDEDQLLTEKEQVVVQLPPRTTSRK